VVWCVSLVHTFSSYPRTSWFHRDSITVPARCPWWTAAAGYHSHSAAYSASSPPAHRTDQPGRSSGPYRSPSECTAFSLDVHERTRASGAACRPHPGLPAELLGRQPMESYQDLSSFFPESSRSATARSSWTGLLEPRDGRRDRDSDQEWRSDLDSMMTARSAHYD